MSDNWVVQNIERALQLWNEKYTEIWQLVTESPKDFKGGSIWHIIEQIYGALQAIGLALLVLFFVVGVMKSCGSLSEIKRPEMGIKLFIRFALAKGVVTYGLSLLLAILEIVQGVTSTIANFGNISSNANSLLPSEIVSAIEACSFWESIPLWAITLIGSLVIWVLSFAMILIVYGRFFKLFMYAAISPIPLSSFAGESTQGMGISFLKSYAAVCMEGVIILLACTIFSIFAQGTPVINEGCSAVTMIWTYLGELIFNMLILVGVVKASDRMVREMMGV